VRGRTSSGGFFDPAAKARRITEIDEASTAADFWLDRTRAQTLLREKARLHEDLERLKRPVGQLREASDLLEMAEADSAPEFEPEIAGMVDGAEKVVAAMEFARMMSGENDRAAAILQIHAGMGGTESQDWVVMLLRMYLRWAERRGFSTEVVDEVPGEEAGLKSVTVSVTGDYAAGYLRAEGGVHRLVRISPFDANARRQTTFASVTVLPDIEDTIEIEVKEEDLRVDTFRSGGAGGQHVNKTDSAVRLTHLPSGIVVACQAERSQHKNRSTALKILKAKLYDVERRKKEAERDKREAEKKDIDFGSQIRSYVLHPYRMVKDLRTGVETGNTDAVLDGELDPFIEAYLIAGMEACSGSARS
jgi:peptide chain release factor 2